MAEDLIRYDILTQDALRAMIAKLLDEVARTGLPGEHHFFITFDTCAPKVQLSSRMKEKYPEEMTIVVQHRFWDLEIMDDRFQIGLSFDEIPETLVVPFAAIKGFYDPSVKFGLQFEVQVAEAEETAGSPPKLVEKDTSNTKAGNGKQKAKRKAGTKSKVKPELFEEILKEDKIDPAAESEQSGEAEEDANSAQVVSLDSFRKKK
ncbi:MAG: hypothetical protein GY742_14200 [Hyphomicrobiales bacterium]|nr:hypothetical protein [Hyphomicrobiales bacterium]